jgi:hypothetical protein
MTSTDQHALDWYITQATQRGFRVIHRTDTAVQLLKPKEWNITLLVLIVVVPTIGGFFWSPLWGLAIIGATIAAVNYAMRKDELEYVTAEQAKRRMDRADLRAAHEEPPSAE